MPSPLLSLVGPATGLLLSAQVENAAFAVVRAEIGAAPTEPGEEAETAVGTEVRPGYALRLTTPRSVFSLTTSPRLYYRSPNVGDVERPLLLGQADARHTYHLRPDLTWASSVGASYGEVDYLSTAEVFDSAVAQNLPDAVVTLFTLRGTTTMDYRISERYSFVTSLLLDHTSYEETRSETLPNSTNIGVELVQVHALSLRDSLVFPFLVRYSIVSDDPDWLTVGTGIGYRRMLDRRTQVDTLAGVGASKVEDGTTEFFPRGLLALQRTLAEREGASLTNRASLALDAVLDPTVGEVRSVFTLDVSLTGSVRERFTQQLAVMASTPAFEDDDSELVGTTIGATATLGYRFTDGFQLETGMRYSARASDAFTSDAEVTDGQIFWFVGFRAAVNLGPDDQSPAWAL